MKLEQKRPRIAFLTSLDPLDKNSWSGIYFSMVKALEKHCGEVVCLGPVNIKLPPYQVDLIKLVPVIFQKIFRKIYAYDFSLLLSLQYAKVFKEKLLSQQFDLIFVPTACVQIAFLETDIPIVYSSDATIKLLMNYYPQYKLLTNKFEANIAEKLAISKSKISLFSSNWAAQSAIKDYSADPEKTRVIPFGANLQKIPDKSFILNRRKAKKNDILKLLFLGVGWQRKGGEIAVETLSKLEEMGIKAELNVCGCTPPKHLSHKGMKTIPFLDKNDDNQLKILEELLLASDFLLLPTRAECFGIVFCEANAFGLPVITTDTGGVSEVIRNGENGFMLPVTARGAEYGKVIYEIYQDKQRYQQLVQSSRQAFDERLNWDAWAIAFKEFVFSQLKI